MMYANAQVLGDVTIGDRSVIANSTVVMASVPEDTLCTGSPATQRRLTRP